jgi:hypothetical protein
MLNIFNIGDHLQFTNNSKVLRYNIFLLNKVYIKKKGYFYEIMFQEIIKKLGYKYTSEDLNNNMLFKRDWIIYKDINHNFISTPYIKRNRAWKMFDEKIQSIPYLYRELLEIKRKINLN